MERRDARHGRDGSGRRREIADAKGAPLPADSPAGLLLDPDGQKLYVVRAADNAVSILDATTLAQQAAIPVGWYPTSVAIAGTKLVVLNGKGYGAGPLIETPTNSGKSQMNGFHLPGRSRLREYPRPSPSRS